MKKNKQTYLYFILIIAVILAIGFNNYNKSVTEKIIIPKCINCNIIIIDLNNVRADHLGVYGYFRNTSPNIDALARDGIFFQNAFAQSSFPLPSIMSMFTSLYPSSYKVDEEHKLNPNISTLAQILKFNNYSTVWIGPLNDPIFPLENGVGRGFNTFLYERINVFDPRVIYWTEALDWLDKNANTTKFFMYLHSYRTMAPYDPSDDTIKKFTNKTNPKIINSYEVLMEKVWTRIDEDPFLIFKEDVIEENKNIFNMEYSLEKKMKMFELSKNYSNVKQTIWQFTIHDVFLETVNSSDSEDVKYLETLYDSSIYEADNDIKNVLDRLKASGIWNKTIIIVTSAHGEELMEHGHLDIFHQDTPETEEVSPLRGLLYEEAIHVPLILALPNSKFQKTFNEMIQGIDIMPTVLDLLNITIPAQAQGFSLVSIIENHSNAPRNQYVYSDLLHFTGKISIRSEDWKFIADLTENKRELYNLRNDPAEKENLISIRKDIANMFEKKLEEYIKIQKIPQNSYITTSNENLFIERKEGFY